MAYLCHESCTENGSVIDAAAGWAGKCHMIRSRGGLLRTSIKEKVTIESVKDNWNAVIDMTTAKRMNNIEVTINIYLSKFLIQ